MSRSLEGRRALVSGASSGIGRAVARALAGAGAHMTLVGRDRDRLAESAASCPGATVSVCDVRDADAVASLVRVASPVDILVNAAGAAGSAPVHEMPVELFDEILATNLRGAFLLCRACLPGMRERGQGTIVNVSSVSARKSFPGMGAYGPSKAAISALSGVIREENRDAGIRVIDLVLGATRTPMWDVIWPDAPRERMLDADSVARLLVDAIDASREAMIEEIVVRPPGGDL